MKKTKVVCTMGPNTNDKEVMRKLIQNGMDVARFNFSHGDHEEQKFRMDLLKELREEEPCARSDSSGHKGTGNPYRSFERRKESNPPGREYICTYNGRYRRR